MSREKSFLEKPQRRPEKAKKPMGEGATDSRMAKISFKNYLRQIEEDLLDEEDDTLDDGPKLPETDDEVQALYDTFLGDNDDIADEAREKGSTEDSAEYCMDELKTYLERKGFTSSTVADWIESDMGQEMYDMFWNGLT